LALQLTAKTSKICAFVTVDEILTVMVLFCDNELILDPNLLYL